MVKEISLIIPSQNAEEKLINLLRCIPNWEIFPNEIIIIDSSVEKFLIPEDFQSFAKKLDIKKLNNLDLSSPDLKKFPCLKLLKKLPEKNYLF